MMRIRVLVTRRTFNKEYDGLSGALYYRKTRLPECCDSGGAASMSRSKRS